MPRRSLLPPTKLGDAIREKRGATSQEATAAELGLSRPTLSRIERGASPPNLRTVRKIARWLGWSLEEVVEASR